MFTLEKPIVDGSGTVRIDDTIWRVAGPDAPAGSRVKVVSADGASLTVAAANFPLPICPPTAFGEGGVARGCGVSATLCSIVRQNDAAARTYRINSLPSPVRR